MTKIASIFQRSRRTLSASISQETKVAFVLLRLAHAQMQRKANYNRSTIDMAVKQMMRREGVENPPAIEWGRLFIDMISKLSRRYGWNKVHQEEVLSAVFQDLLMGMNMDTGARWAKGNLAQQVKDLQAAGKNEKDISTLIARQIAQEAPKKSAKLQGNSTVHTMTPSDMGDSFDADTGGGGANLLVSLLSMDPLTRGEASSWMNLSRRDPEIRDYLRMIDKHIARQGDESMSLVWQALKENPDFGSKTELAREVIEYVDPETRRVTKAPLYVALGQDEPRKINYYFARLQKALQSLKPMIEDRL